MAKLGGAWVSDHVFLFLYTPLGITCECTETERPAHRLPFIPKVVTFFSWLSFGAFFSSSQKIDVTWSSSSSLLSLPATKVERPPKPGGLTSADGCL